MNNATNRRLAYIDIAKGIGILMVVLGHIRTSLYLHDAIYLFHMPLFFLLSGMVFKENEEWLTCMKKKVKYLLLPYLFFMVMFVPLRMITDTLCNGGTFPIFRLSMLGLSYFDKPLWFVFALFVVIGIVRTLLSFVHNKLVTASMVCILGIAGYLLLSQHMELPLHLSRALFGLPFFVFGVMVRKHHQIKSFVIIGLLMYSLGLYGLWNGHTVLDTLKLQVDSNPFFVYIPAIGGTLLVVGLSLSLDKMITLNKYSGGLIGSISYLGRNSFYVFAVHHPFILFINSLYWRELEESEFLLSYAVMLTISSIIFSLLVGRLLRRLVPSIFK